MAVRDLEWGYLVETTEAARGGDGQAVIHTAETIGRTPGFNPDVEVLYLEAVTIHVLTELLERDPLVTDIASVVGLIYPKWHRLVSDDRQTLERALRQACGYRGSLPRLSMTKQLPYLIAAVGALIAELENFSWTKARLAVGDRISPFEAKLREMNAWQD